MRIKLRPTLLLEKSSLKGGDFIDLALVHQILDGLSNGKALVVIAKQLGLNYRNLNKLLTILELNLKAKIVIKVKGHGTLLTSSGEKLLKFLEKSDSDLNQARHSYQESLITLISSFGELPNFTSKWIFYSSSDPIVQSVVKELGGFELKIAGSGESLDGLLSGDADVAGYHVSSESDSKIIYKRLSKQGIEIYPVMKRTQGLITQKGNPLGIKSIADLTRPKVRFINRQIGSGTRLLLDTILLEEDIDASTINGYLHEEYTHSAVATAILAKKADVGLGVKNIAIAEGLDFIPLRDEIFFLAIKEGVSKDPLISKLIRKIRKNSSETPGYKSVGLNRQINEWVG